MRILFVHPAAAMSIADVARGYRSALERQGHEIADYSLRARFAYHTKAMPPAIQDSEPHTLSRMASECILNEAMYHRAELVVVVSGLNLHPIALWALGEVGIPIAVIFTESPYDDDSQATWANLQRVDPHSKVEMHLFTNDRYSAERYGWGYLPPSCDPAYHRPVAPNVEDACDVLMVGTGWPERQAFLEAVDWTGIDLRLYGVWTGITPDSPLFRHLRPMLVNNDRIAEMYCSAKININFHRRSAIALTPGPRVFELAGCGAFQLSDPRPDMDTIFGPWVPTFDSPTRLQSMLWEFLDPDGGAERRRYLSTNARQCVLEHTFDHRAAELMGKLATLRSGAPVPVPVPVPTQTPALPAA